ncbi:MAG TPA: ABC transporter permease [Bryobacteraceae bacterium]|nr:ABC transporter permease [Bryobacteraceae bacterium]
MSETALTAPRESANTTSLTQLALMRFREFIREPEAVFWTFIFPILLAAGLGIAFRNKPADVMKVAVVNNGHAGSYAQWLARDRSLRIRQLDESDAFRALRTGAVALVVIPQPGGGVTYRYDDTNPDGRAARATVDNAIQRGAGRVDPVPARDDRDREPGARYIDFLIPGLIGMNMMGSGMWGIGFSIVDARRRKLLKRLIASPMSRGQYLASYLLSRLVFLVLEVGVVAAFGIFVFGVPFRGDPGAFVLICLLSALAFSALGLLTASRARTIEGISGIMNLIMLPMWVLSGVFFSADRFPDAVQPIIRALPLTAVIDALRMNMLQGLGLAAVRGQILLLATWLLVSFAVALRIFRWR